MNQTTTHSKVRRFLKIAKRVLSLVLTVIEIIERLLNLFR
jgi:hypothetical protein